jgi:hypothetical protein
MPIRKSQSRRRTLRELVSTTRKDKQYSGFYEAADGVVRVTYEDLGPVCTQFRSHPEVTARHLLCELVKESLKRSSANHLKCAGGGIDGRWALTDHFADYFEVTDRLRCILATAT